MAAPRIDSIAPTTGPTGTTVVISGANFGGVNSVKFNGVEASSFTVTGSTGYKAPPLNDDPNPSPDVTLSGPMSRSAINAELQKAGTNASIKFVGTFNLDGPLKVYNGQTLFAEKSTRSGPKAATFQAASGATRAIDLKGNNARDVTISDIRMTGFKETAVTMWYRCNLRRLRLDNCYQKGLGANFDNLPDVRAKVDTCLVDHNGNPGGIGNNVGGFKGIETGPPFAEPGSGLYFLNTEFSENIGVGCWWDHGAAGDLTEACIANKNWQQGFRYELCNGYAKFIGCSANGNGTNASRPGFDVASSAWVEYVACSASGNTGGGLDIIEEERAKNHMHKDMNPSDIHIGAYKDGFYLEGIKVSDSKMLGDVHVTSGRMHQDAVTISPGSEFGSEISAVVPPSATTGTIVVKNADGSDTSGVFTVKTTTPEPVETASFVTWV